VRERTAELRQVNQELEAFSYSVSHDLRRPLRAVTGFTDILMSSHAGDLSQDARKLLTMTRDSALQMGQMVEALLSLSRIERQPLAPRPVNLTALVRQTLTELQAEQPDRNMEIRVADLPGCMGDPALLRQVLVNLLSNAMKYTRNRPVQVIEIGFKTEDGETVYYVRDNGAGFDMRYADKLFGVFQRLHSAEEFSGTGVGLSIVRRIIHRHGGRIWAEAAVDKGATFYFTLPQTGLNCGPS
jgi:light-regulated signal transduction histidine kinase (bacteriophytochrome)